MPDTAAAQLRRVLLLIPRLADGVLHSYEEIVGLVGTDAETIKRDLRSIAERFDDPGGFLDNIQIFMESGGVKVTAMHFHRPMRLTLAELGALELGLALVAAGRTPEDRKPIASARERLRQVIAKLPKDPFPPELHVAGESGSEHDLATLAIIGKAMRNNRKVRLAYRGGSAKRTSQRVVCPYQYAYAVGAWYLIAHCEQSKGIRVFRVDRIESVERLDDTYVVPADFSPKDIVKDGQVFHGGAPETVTIRYGPAVARWIAEREHRTLEKDGSLVREYPLADPTWVVRHVLQYGADAEVVGPPGARAAVRAALQRITSAD